MDRLISVVNKLKIQLELLKRYSDLFKEKQNMDIIEETDWNAESDGLVHYIPHQPVIRFDKATTKLWIVYDASVRPRQGDRSLNDAMVSRASFVARFAWCALDIPNIDNSDNSKCQKGLSTR